MQPHRLATRLFVAALAASAPAFADELTVTAGVQLTLTPWSQTVSVPRFNPALGALSDVRVELRNSIRGRVGYENLNAAPASSVVSFQGTLALSGPGSLAMTTVSSTPVAIQTQAFDGANDQGGSSGGLVANLLVQRSTTGAVLPNLVGNYVGAGNVALQLSASNTSALASGSALALSTRVTLDAQVLVTYVYSPVADCDHDGIPDSSETDSDGDGLPDDCDHNPASYNRPGSLLVYPEFDNSAGTQTIITLTSSHTGPGSVTVHFVYIDGTNCNEFNRNVVLAPNDTFSALTTNHSGGVQRGFLYVYAIDGLSRPIAHDFLSGSSLRFDGVSAYAYGIDALAFKAAPGVTLTDVDGDGLRDLNGLEYDKAPDELLFPRFMGTTASLDSDLILINLTGGHPFTAVVNFLVYDDNTNVYSAQAQFSCWMKRTLSSINPVFTNSFLHNSSPNDPNEIVGMPANEAGWFKLDGVVSASPNIQIADPAILGVLVERSGVSSFATEMPFYLGEQANGDLLITSPNGDTVGN